MEKRIIKNLKFDGRYKREFRACNAKSKRSKFWLEEKFNPINFTNPKNPLNKLSELVSKGHLFCNLATD